MKLIVIDMQKALMDDGLYNLHGLIQNTVRLIETARKNGEMDGDEVVDVLKLG